MVFMYYVYVLLSLATGKRYIGQTDDLERRLKEHNNPDHNPRKFTSKQKGPWKRILPEEYPTRREAMARERWLKSGVGRAWLDTITSGASPPKAD